MDADKTIETLHHLALGEAQAHLIAEEEEVTEEMMGEPGHPEDEGTACPQT